MINTPEGPVERVKPEIRAEYKDGCVSIHYWPKGADYDTPEWWNVSLGHAFVCDERVGRLIVDKLNGA